MLNSALKRRAIPPGLCHPALNLRPIGLAMKLDEFPHMRCHIKEKRMGASDHGPVNADPLFARGRCDAFQRRLL